MPEHYVFWFFERYIQIFPIFEQTPKIFQIVSEAKEQKKDAKKNVTRISNLSETENFSDNKDINIIRWCKHRSTIHDKSF